MAHSGKPLWILYNGNYSGRPNDISIPNQPVWLKPPCIFNYYSTNSYLVILVCGVLRNANPKVIMFLSEGIPACNPPAWFTLT